MSEWQLVQAKPFFTCGDGLFLPSRKYSAAPVAAWQREQTAGISFALSQIWSPRVTPPPHPIRRSLNSPSESTRQLPSASNKSQTSRAPALMEASPID